MAASLPEPTRDLEAALEMGGGGGAGKGAGPRWSGGRPWCSAEPSWEE